MLAYIPMVFLIAFMNENELMESLDHALDELIDVLTKKFDDKEEK